VGAGVVEVFALQPDARAALGPAVVLAEPLGLIEGIRPPHIGAQQVVEPVGEGRIGPGLSRRLLQFRQGGDKGFGHILAAELAVAAQAVGACIQGQGGRIGAAGGVQGGNGAGHRRRSKITAA